MKIERHNDDHLVLSHIRWKAPLAWAGIALVGLGLAGLAAQVGSVGAMVWALILGVAIPAGIALLLAHRSQLILDRRAGTAEFRERSIRGYTNHRFSLGNVQGTRVVRGYRGGKTAAEDPYRYLKLYVKAGMDEGRYSLTRARLPSETALDISARVNEWMRPVRREFAPSPAPDPEEMPASLDS